MVIAFCNIYFGLVANCDWFFFIYVVCHISIFLRSQIVTLNVLLLIIAFKKRIYCMASEPPVCEESDICP